MKLKKCSNCNKEFDTLYRIQEGKGKAWRFVCKECIPSFQAMEGYRYGGTWKGYRH